MPLHHSFFVVESSCQWAMLALIEWHAFPRGPSLPCLYNGPDKLSPLLTLSFQYYPESRTLTWSFMVEHAFYAPYVEDATSSVRTAYSWFHIQAVDRRISDVSRCASPAMFQMRYHEKKWICFLNFRCLAESKYISVKQRPYATCLNLSNASYRVPNGHSRKRLADVRGENPSICFFSHRVPVKK